MAHSCRPSPLKASVVFCEFTGRLDAASALPLKEELDLLLSEGRTRLVASVRNLEVISAAGIKVLLDFHQRSLEKKGGVKLVGVGPRIRRILDLAQVSDFWGSYESEEDAVRSFSPSRAG